MAQSFHFSDLFVTLAEQEEEELTQFYTQLLSCEPTVCIPHVYSEFQLPGLRLGIFKPKATHRAEFTSCSGGSMSLCIEVEDLAAAIAHLTSMGHPPPGAPMKTSHGTEIYAYDPAGNRLILHQSQG